MIAWPEKPTCHDRDISPVFKVPDRTWRPPDFSREPFHYPFRTCSYCGSIHPEDLLAFLAKGATLQGADWKYGRPHKFYVAGIPNPLAGQRVAVGHRSGPDLPPEGEPIYGTASETTPAKWYNTHLLELNGEAFDLVAAALKVTGIAFERDEKGVKFRCGDSREEKA